jgi:hypothetical protein
MESMIRNVFKKEMFNLDGNGTILSSPLSNEFVLAG